MKPELRKLSRYWLILMAPSQSSTELKVLKSGMDLSNSGCEGLEGGAERRVRRCMCVLEGGGFDAMLSKEH